MIQLDNILLEEEIIKVKFACDLDKCKGGCCTFPGEHGAPLHDEEITELEDALEPASEYLTQNSLDYIEEHGLYEGTRGSYTTNCIDKKDCVFVYYEESIARCAIEKAFFDGKTKFRKPLSCQLFPIRAAQFGGKYLYYQQFPECKPGIKRGLEEDVMLYKFLREPLIRAYGEDWYDSLCKYVESEEEPTVAPDYWEVK